MVLSSANIATASLGALTVIVRNAFLLLVYKLSLKKRRVRKVTRRIYLKFQFQLQLNFVCGDGGVAGFRTARLNQTV